MGSVISRFFYPAAQMIKHQLSKAKSEQHCTAHIPIKMVMLNETINLGSLVIP